jgi:predicted dinucleotide-binding enzyme
MPLPPRATSLEAGNASEVTAGLIRDIGFDPVDAGPSRMARYAGPFAFWSSAHVQSTERRSACRTSGPRTHFGHELPDL